MLPFNARIFISCHLSETGRVQTALEQVRAAGWSGLITLNGRTSGQAISELIQTSDMVLVFLSKTYLQDSSLMLEQFAYASTIVRKPFLPVWLDSLKEIQGEYPGGGQLLSALEMLTAKHMGTAINSLSAALAAFTPDRPPYAPSTPQVCEKPCEAYEGDEPYIFVSYAHDDAKRVYPAVKDLFEAGWRLWYDEGIKTTQRYLPVIADHVKRCKVFVLMLTKRCLARPFVMDYELAFARTLGVTVVPVALEDVPGWAGEDAITPDALLGHVRDLGLLTSQEMLRKIIYNPGRRNPN